MQDIDSLPDTALPGWLDLAELRSWPGWVDVAWAVLWILGLACIVVFGRWEAVPFHLIWIAFALVYSFRVRTTGGTLWVLAAMAVTTFAAITVDVLRGIQPADELTTAPLMAAMFWVMAWHGRRRQTASAERTRLNDENERLLTTQRQFLQDASHQLRTPITIALGHSELLARHLADNQDKRDISVIVGELNRLRLLSERLLVIAASASPDLLQLEPVHLTDFAMDVLWRWRPTADRRWELGRLDDATVSADRERLGLAVDALLENAVRHTDGDGTIRLSVVSTGRPDRAELVVEDTGAGISANELEHIFERFTTGSHAMGRRGTGLGLALVRAVAAGHGGTVAAYSALGQGSRFELTLPLAASAAADQPGSETYRSVR